MSRTSGSLSQRRVFRALCATRCTNLFLLVSPENRGPDAPKPTGHWQGSSTLTPKKPLVRHSTPTTIASASTPSIYKHVRNATGVVGMITDPSGITSNVTNHIINTVGASRAAYLDAHGFGPTEIRCLSNAYDTATDVGHFVSLAAGCGMAVTELEWFWALS